MNTQTYHSFEWSEIVLLTFVYALYIFLVTAPIGFFISGIKVYRFKRSIEQEKLIPSHEAILIATHHEWLVRSFVGMLVMSMAAVGTLYYIFGYVIGAIALTWWLYRMVRGITALIAYREMPAPICTKARCFGQVTTA
jgi:uncharacterized membrane protein